MKALTLLLALGLAAPLATAQANHNTTRSNRTAPVAADTCDDDCDGDAVRATDYNSSRSNKNGSAVVLLDPDDDGDTVWEIVAAVEHTDDWVAARTSAGVDVAPVAPTRGAGDPDTTDPTPIYMTLQLAPSVAPPGSRVEVFRHRPGQAEARPSRTSAHLAPLSTATVMGDGTARLQLPGVDDAVYTLRVFRADGTYGDDLVLRKRPGRAAAPGGTCGGADCPRDR